MMIAASPSASPTLAKGSKLNLPYPTCAVGDDLCSIFHPDTYFV
jgi:hypothetical protein